MNDLDVVGHINHVDRVVVPQRVLEVGFDFGQDHLVIAVVAKGFVRPMPGWAEGCSGFDGVLATLPF